MNEVRPFTKFIRDLNKSNLVGVEIGVMGGANTLTMFETLNIDRMYLVDIFDNYNGLQGHGVLDTAETGKKCYDGSRKNLNKYLDRIVWLVDLSENAVNQIHEEVDFVYIDGNHRYEYVKKDIELYFKIVKSGGVLGGHDYKYEEQGVIKAVNELFPDEGVYQDEWDWWVVKE